MYITVNYQTYILIPLHTHHLPSTASYIDDINHIPHPLPSTPKKNHSNLQTKAISMCKIQHLDFAYKHGHPTTTLDYCLRVEMDKSCKTPPSSQAAENTLELCKTYELRISNARDKVAAKFENEITGSIGGW